MCGGAGVGAEALLRELSGHPAAAYLTADARPSPAAAGPAATSCCRRTTSCASPARVLATAALVPSGSVTVASGTGARCDASSALK